MKLGRGDAEFGRKYDSVPRSCECQVLLVLCASAGCYSDESASEESVNENGHVKNSISSWLPKLRVRPKWHLTDNSANSSLKLVNAFLSVICHWSDVAGF